MAVCLFVLDRLGILKHPVSTLGTDVVSAGPMAHHGSCSALSIGNWLNAFKHSKVGFQLVQKLQLNLQEIIFLVCFLLLEDCEGERIGWQLSANLLPQSQDNRNCEKIQLELFEKYKFDVEEQ